MEPDPFTHSTAFCYRPPAPGDPPTALVLLNSATPATPASLAFLRAVWRCASLVVAADGAAGRLFYALLREAGCGEAPRAGAEAEPAPLALLRAFLPRAICGDFDSLDARAAAFYGAQGVALLPAPEDQDSTDLEKCLAYLAAQQAAPASASAPAPAAPRPFNVVALGPCGGRLDHEAQNLNCLLTRGAPFAGLALLSEHSVARALPAGDSRVRVAAPFEGPTCGLLPLCGPTTLTTRGLQWDVEEWPSAFGGRVSTSNRVRSAAEGARVRASAPLVWTVCVNAAAVVAEGGAA